MFGILITNVIPAFITASIAQERGISPVVGFGIGMLLSWPGMVLFAIFAPRFDARGRLRTSKRSTTHERPTRRQNEARRAASVAEYAAKKEAERKAALLRQREADLAARDIELEQVRDELADANARAETAEKAEKAARQLAREADRKAAMEEADRFWAEADRESAGDPLRDVFTNGMPRTSFTDGDAPTTRASAPSSKPGARKTSAAGEEG